MQPDELLKVLWRRKLIILLVTTLAIGTAAFFLDVQPKVYEAESKVALTPGETDELVFFSQINAIIPIYADAATSEETRLSAEDDIGSPIPDVAVETTDGQSIFRITVRHNDPELAAAGAQAVTDALFSRAAIGDIGLPEMRLTQVEQPRVPTDPVFPLPAVTYVVAGIVGLAMGAGFGLVRESLNNRVEDSAALTRLTGLPCFSEIPREAAVVQVRTPQHLLERQDLRIVAEAFRDLRTNLMFSVEDLRSIMITSPEGRHGKTTVSFGLAVTLAKLGTRTVLVDGDLRRGRLAEMLQTGASPGLHEAMTGRPVRTVTKRSTMNGLDVITSGALSADPGELFNFAFPRVLTELQEMYDLVVIDATPLVPINDARIMASFVDATLLVVDAGGASRQQVRIAIERLSMIGMQPTATVLNKSRLKQRSGYYAYLSSLDEISRRRSRLLPRRGRRSAG